MIDKETIAQINDAGAKLSSFLEGFYGKITFNFQDGRYVNSNVEQSIIAGNAVEADKERYCKVKYS